MATKKAPRRTAQRILEASLDLFNRFGEPNVPTTLIAAELGISPGNLYYHYPAKDELVNRLYADYEQELKQLLAAAGSVQDVEDAWFFMHSLFELIWRYRFLYRDLNDLLTKNRYIETQLQQVLAEKSQALDAMVEGMCEAGSLAIDPREAEPLAQSMVVVLTYWLSFEYVRNPREALEPAHAQGALLRGAWHTLRLLAPYLAPDQRQHLLALSDAYNMGGASGRDAQAPSPEPATSSSPKALAPT
ncbi:TetR/AcrR family transcriptional regulator [Variovorax sp. OV329]|uniref:TetR/AcrR family transcriptional regulator n=1 Tax=Variovorax sp. OV329 TaxID=1882825 RepID=UPI0008E71D41|nr:TetR/AcrR family transcriptional regulator [Variovorax sp. OV329]SFN07379.1 transcriptional regulator, TetR family [Variovorax sp. OV329]